MNSVDFLEICMENFPYSFREGPRSHGASWAVSTSEVPPYDFLNLYGVFSNYGTYFLRRTAGEGTEGTETKVGATTSTSTTDTNS